MSETREPEEDAPKKSSKLPLILALVLALLGGGGGFYAVYSGMLLGGESAENAKAETGEEDAPPRIGDLPDVAYLEVTPLVVSLGEGATGTHLRFSAQLEVGAGYKEEVAKVMPRVVDVLNSYLRALDMRDLADSAALMRIRAQMLRRIQIVTGGDRVRDLLIMEFVLN